MKVIRKKALVDRLGLSLAAVNELARTDPTFPKILKIGARGRAAGFLDHEVDQWLTQKASEAHHRFAARKALGK